MRGALGLAAGIVVVVAVGAGLFVLGRPVDERARRLDERRVDDLRRLAAAVDLYWTRHGGLPSSTEALGAEPGIRLQLADPEPPAVYEYRALGGMRYEVCATFTENSPDTRPGGDTFWAHGRGRQCFAREVRRVR